MESQDKESDGEVTQREACVSDDAVYQAVVAEAAAFSKTAVTVSSLFLGGSLTLLSAFRSPGLCALVTLGFGCAALIATIALVAAGHWYSLLAGKSSFAQDRRSAGYEAVAFATGTLSLISFVVGLTLVSVGVFLTIMEHGSE